MPLLPLKRKAPMVLYYSLVTIDRRAPSTRDEIHVTLGTWG